MTSRRFPTPATARRLLAALGVALALAAIWLDVLDSGSGSYWSDHSTGVFLLVVGILCGVPVAASLLPGRRRLLALAACPGAALWGFYLFLPALYAFDRLGRLGAGGWLGAAAGALVVLPCVPFAELVARGAGREPEAPPLLLARLFSGAGFVVFALSLWFTAVRTGGAEPLSLSYWNSSGRHSLGIFMLCVAACGLLLVGAAALTRLLVLEGLALGLALVLVGLSIFYPVVLATGEIDTLRPAGWLALAGSSLAAAAAAATLALESRAATGASVEPGAAGSSRAVGPGATAAGD